MNGGRVTVVEIRVRMILTDGLDIGRRVGGQASTELKGVQVAKASLGSFKVTWIFWRQILVTGLAMLSKTSLAWIYRHLSNALNFFRDILAHVQRQPNQFPDAFPRDGGSFRNYLLHLRRP